MHKTLLQAATNSLTSPLKLLALYSEDHGLKHAVDWARAATLAAINSVGLAALPNEIFYEILSYMPAVQILADTDESNDNWVDHSRRFTLSALSQTCRSLRRFFLSHLWERIELYDNMMKVHRGFAFSTVRVRALFKELGRQLEAPTERNPELAQYVQYVSVFWIHTPHC